MKFFLFIVVYILLSIASIVFLNVDWKVVAVITFILFMCSVFYFGFKDSFKSDMKTIRLNETGELVQATVLSIKQTNIYNGEDPEVIIELKVQETDGTFYQATARGTVKLVELAAHQPGSQIEVVRDRENREQIVLKEQGFEKTQALHQTLREVRRIRQEQKAMKRKQAE